MTCSSAQNSVMLYQEKRIKPLKAIALHRHLNKCEDCREFFLAMGEASDLELSEAPDGFVESTMLLINKSGVTPKLISHTTGSFDYLRLAGCLFSLFLAASIVIMYYYNIEMVQVPDPTIGAWIDAFFGGLAQAGQTVALYTANIMGELVNHILIFAVVLILTAIGIDAGNTAKKYE